VSILLAVAVGDVVVLMAEGGEIVALRENLALALSGPKVGTELAANELRNFTPALAPNVLSQLKRVSFGAASHAAGLNGGGARISLLAAGFDAHGAFVTGAKYEGALPKPESVLVRALDAVAFTVMGDDAAGTQAQFAAKLSSLFPEGKLPEADRAQLASLLLDAGTETIRSAAPGSQVDYRILRRGQPAETGSR
jgi:hypothetical protein